MARLLAAVGALVLVACSAAASDPAPFSAGSNSDSEGNDPSSSSESTTTDGTSTARAMLGLPAKASKDAALADAESATTKLLTKVEGAKKGTLASLGVALASGDAKKAATAFANTRSAIVSAASSSNAHDVTNIPVLGQGPDGRFGDDRTGAGGALQDAPDFTLPPVLDRPGVLSAIDGGSVKPDPESRLGAYAATAGYAPGTVGYGVHRAIGGIFLAFGNYGQEKIGRVFNDPQAKALYNDPVDSDSGYKMAQTELKYWNNVAAEDSWSAGGKLGSAFSAPVRNWIQNTIGGADLSPTDCNDKTDGWWCLQNSLSGGWMAYCKGGQIASGCPCLSCTHDGKQATCAADPPPAACPAQ